MTQSTEELLGLCRDSLDDVRAFRDAGQRAATGMAAPGGPVEPALLEKHQYAVHGFAWMATYAAALEQLLGWAERLNTAGRLGDLERLMLSAGFGAYLNQLKYGIAMSQDEIVRPGDLGLDESEFFNSAAARQLMANGNAIAVRQAIAECLRDRSGDFGDRDLDETNTMIADQFHRFADARVSPYAHGWHVRDELIPMDVIQDMAELGVFGLTIPEADGGLGMGKVSMCVVTEELSRGYIGVGSLGTRSEIAAELIRLNGTPEQKERYLAPIAAGSLLPTAVFTEPNHGSDLARIRTRAARDGAVYRVTGNKIWITHAARTDMMTLMARTDPDENGYRGLSMFLADKPRGTEDNPFPANGMTGSEIRVLGYRGMKEYELGFDGFEVSADGLLGGREGDGFKQLMTSFETARIQTAARAIGVAQNALELGFGYAQDREQFRKPIVEFARVGGKLGWMATETMIARQLTYFAARQKDSDQRCDIEAGMAKLLAARVAWSNADNSLQVHGGNGYAEEYDISRVLCDARILNIFEGAAEIQAGIIARGLLGRPNRPA
ncbi:MAG: acyl-CoA/acyl-ACP dehydrogenase [Rhodospirillaceae bacterium]|jgi:(2S)-methylsuccinyl-CoA dehydrogenase|nr:acyl-CoA/acyl-ACP dehydrogenase [Rhodospirillaceae bacterium]MBT6535337.1 acyl-CoA/acyl-ACP dehydrogenase [Rhodospirillaceae bacterium]